MEIGAQLFTVKEYCQTLDGLAESLKKVAEIGYKNVQLSGVCEYDSEWMNERLRENGLKANITHTRYDKIVGMTDETIAFHKAMGIKYIGLGSIPGFKKSGCDLALYDKFVEEISKVLDPIYEAGCKFMYHNHSMEFLKTPKGNILEMLCELFPKEKFGITLDTYWVAAAGGDPVYWIKKLEGRLNCVHFKDMSYSCEDRATRMAAVGSGNMNYPEIIKACIDVGVEYAYVEQDRCYGEDPFDCLKQSYDYLASFGLR